MKLTDTEINETYVITNVLSDKNLIRRVLDFGIIKGTGVERLFSSPFGDPTAYRIKNSVVAMRKSESDKILVEKICGGDCNGTEF